MQEIYSKLSLETPERRRFSVSSVNVQQVSHITPVFLLLYLGK